MKEINVHIGEVKIARNGETLKTILGSCVGIGFMWKKKSICGLAHCLLSKSPDKTLSIGGRFVDQAIRSLIVLMKIRPENLSEIEVIVAGGGNMTQPDAKNLEQLVGSQNFMVAESELKRIGIKPSRIDRGGEEGRKITIYSADCTYVIECIPRLVQAA